MFVFEETENSNLANILMDNGGHHLVLFVNSFLLFAAKTSTGFVLISTDGLPNHFRGDDCPLLYINKDWTSVAELNTLIARPLPTRAPTDTVFFDHIFDRNTKKASRASRKVKNN